MTAVELSTLLKQLDLRRRKLGMGLGALARKSGVSMRTVCRVLKGQGEVSFAGVCAIASALGMRVDLTPIVDVDGMREREARKKAERLVDMVQGTSGLEAQAVDKGTIRQMVHQTVHELLAGSGRKLWGE
jgi:transcriptional regulator with XRE-family HTH domain